MKWLIILFTSPVICLGPINLLLFNLNNFYDIKIQRII